MDSFYHGAQGLSTADIFRGRVANRRRMCYNIGNSRRILPPDVYRTNQQEAFMMKQISVGTCVQGPLFTQWVPGLIDKGFECFTVNFHMSLDGVVLSELAPQVRSLLDGTGIKISSLGFYCNALMYEEHEKQLHECIDMAEAFGTKTVSTFAGALKGESVEAAMPKFKEVFGRLARHAEDKGVRIALENCSMGGTWYKNTDNIGFNPRAWDMMFNEVASDALGLEWEPTHQMCQLIDPIACLRKYVGKVIHIHGKDANIKHDVIAAQGFMGPDSIVDSRFPGFGDTDWRQIFAILQNAGYEGCISIEGYHDFLYNGQWEMTGQMHSLNYLTWCRGGSFIPNPWEA